MRIVSAALAVCALAGCNLYFNHGNGDDVCAGTGAAGEIAPAQELRDPSTGICEPFGGGGCGYCTPCAADDVAYKTPAQPADWASCYGRCEQLDETTCIATAGCRVAYAEGLMTDPALHFLGCWETAPSGPVHDGTCTNLDAADCSRHDNCAAYYTSGPADGQTFERCAPESGNTCDAIDCGAGSHCEQQCSGAACQPACVPDTLCAATTCQAGYTCVETCTAGTGPDCGDGTNAGTCTVSCVPPTGTCETLGTEAECTARPDCIPVYLGDNCTCTPSGCTCQVETYERCETAGLGL